MPRQSTSQGPSAPPGIIASPEELALYRKKFGEDRVKVDEPTPFQTNVLLRWEKEIFCGGGKFGGKSWTARAFLLKGNPDKPNYDKGGNPLLVNQSYVFSDDYRATILRRNQIDLDDFIQKFTLMVRPYGGVFASGKFTFPRISRATIAVGHLADRDSWQKYIGVENVRLVIEEAALIPEFGLYEQMLTTCRSINPELRAQILITSNAGGPGTSWLIERFYEAKNADGNIVPPGQTIYDEGPDPFDSTKTVTTTRVFMFSTMRDNPHAEKDPSYKATMATLKDEKLRKAYIHGEWRVFTGQYFQTWDIAHHTIAPSDPRAELQPWYPRIGSIDVGAAHETAVYVAAQLPTRQHLVYKEMCVSGFSSYVVVGYEIGRMVKDELEKLPSHSITFFISHDAFAKRHGTESKCIAEMLAVGIAKVVGPDLVHIPDLVIEQLKKSAESENRELSEEALESIRRTRRSGIVLRRALPDRVIGWSYCREALRIERIGPEAPAYDPRLAQALLLFDQDKYEEYERLYRLIKVESLPKCLILWEKGRTDLGCPRLVEAIPKARHYPMDQPGKDPEDVDKHHFRGMDSLDSWRYLEVGINELQMDEPYESWRDRSVGRIVQAEPDLEYRDKVMINRMLESAWEERNRGAAATLIIPRKSSRKRHEAWVRQLGSWEDKIKGRI